MNFVEMIIKKSDLQRFYDQGLHDKATLATIPRNARNVTFHQTKTEIIISYNDLSDSPCTIELGTS